MPVDIQARHLSKSKEWLAEYFGNPPIGFGPPGDAFSYDLKANNFTYKVAAENGFGLGNDKRFLFYLDGEKVIKFRMTKTRKLEDVPELAAFDLPIPMRWHDHDHRIHGLDFLEKHLLALEKKNNKKLNYISMDTFNAYLHTRVEAAGGGEINFTITPDPYFSRNFFNDQSSWLFSIIPALKNEVFSSELSFYLEGEKIPAQAIKDSNTYLLSLPKFFEPRAGLKVSNSL